jgi:hypothetical protein
MGDAATEGTTMIEVHNHGPLIVATNYWDSDLARAGKVYVSVNAGAIRVLLPPAHYGALADMRAASECVLSRGPWPAEGRREAVEIMWDDGSSAPFTMHVTPESFDALPGEPEPGREWICSVWTAKDGRPHKALERICHWRRVLHIPCLAPWGE